MGTQASQERAVITVLGSDRPGIVAAISGLLAQHRVNILDISQTILSGLFTMTTLVDLSGAQASFEELSHEFEDVARELGVQINFQREEVFEYMNRL